MNTTESYQRPSCFYRVEETDDGKLVVDPLVGSGLDEVCKAMFVMHIQKKRPVVMNFNGTTISMT